MAFPVLREGSGDHIRPEVARGRGQLVLLARAALARAHRDAGSAARVAGIVLDELESMFLLLRPAKHGPVATHRGVESSSDACFS